MKSLINSLLAGLSISIGGFAFLSSGDKLTGAFLFSIGLFLICTMKYDLFTGKVCYLFSKEDVKFGYICIVLAMNLVATAFMGWVTRTIKPNLVDIANKLCETKLHEGFSVIPLAILCNVLIFYAVYEFATNDHIIGKYVAVLLCVVTFIMCGFEHCIANMYYFSVANYPKGSVNYLLTNIVGNALGGMIAYRLEVIRNKE